MTPEKQRIAIAKACGWTIFRSQESIFYWNEEINKTLPEGDDGMRDGIPDYLNDLNALHEAEKVLRPPIETDWRVWSDYRDLLEYMMGCEETIHATAAHRAEAFLKTLGLWEDEKLREEVTNNSNTHV